jgi:hypothetical protein
VKDVIYLGIEIEKIEDINHFGKRLKRALQEIKRQCGKKKLSDGKTIGGKGRLTGNNNKESYCNKKCEINA